MIYISTDTDRQPVTKTFTPLHYTSPKYTSLHFTSSHLNFTQLYFRASYVIVGTKHRHSPVPKRMCVKVTIWGQ